MSWAIICTILNSNENTLSVNRGALFLNDRVKNIVELVNLLRGGFGKKHWFSGSLFLWPPSDDNAVMIRSSVFLSCFTPFRLYQLLWGESCAVYYGTGCVGSTSSLEDAFRAFLTIHTFLPKRHFLYITFLATFRKTLPVFTETDLVLPLRMKLFRLLVLLLLSIS